MDSECVPVSPVLGASGSAVDPAPVAGAEGRRVAFSESVEVAYFARRPAFDRFPSDSLALPLGMDYSPFHVRTEALSEEKDTRYKLPVLDLPCRRSLLDSGLEDEGAPSPCERGVDLLELMDIESAAAHSGCRCLGGICGAQCECVQAGIFCCTGNFPAGRTSCTCRQLITQNGIYCSNVDMTLASAWMARNTHYRRTFALLGQEWWSECEEVKVDTLSVDDDDMDTTSFEQSVDDHDIVWSRSD